VKKPTRHLTDKLVSASSDNPVNRKVLHRESGKIRNRETVQESSADFSSLLLASGQFKRLLYHVEVAEHGLEALTILKSYALAGESFDMVLMDLESEFGSEAEEKKTRSHTLSTSSSFSARTGWHQCTS